MSQTPRPAYRSLLPHLIEIARRAGAAIEATRDAANRPEQKGDGSPVTESDRAAEDVIVTALAALDPATPIVSEEAGVPSVAEREGWTRFWLVDPLDGTREFIAGLPDYTVNIALIDEGEPVLGVVYAPARQLTYYAGKALGAWRQADGAEPVRIYSHRPAPGAPLRLLESRAHRSAALDAFASQFLVSERIAVGSSLKFCWLAEGRADVYPRFTPIMEWDVAAGDCVFRWSSPTAVPHASPLSYNRPDMTIPEFVVGFPPMSRAR